MLSFFNYEVLQTLNSVDADERKKSIACLFAYFVCFVIVVALFCFVLKRVSTPTLNFCNGCVQHGVSLITDISGVT